MTAFLLISWILLIFASYKLSTVLLDRAGLL